ncbi:hypothetical protein ACHAWT_008652 [Skeletonema menzelii]|eukprot:scaffold2359_cov132-Skeletonema_menzelii.AAC.8
MSEDLWETIDWGDDVVNDTSTHPPAFFDRKDTAATTRLSGSSTRSEECEKPSDQPTIITFSERKQHGRKKRSSWFDADLTKLVPLEDEKGGYSSGRSQCKASRTTVEDEPRRRIGRRQSDYVLEKRRIIEKHASLAERPVSRSLTKRFLSSVGLRKNSEAASVSSDDDDLDVPFPTNIRRKSCY